MAPWQLFFQQSNIIDKGITTRWINYERTDTVLGSFVVVIGASLLIVTAAFAFAHTAGAGHFTNAGGVAHGLARDLGHGAGAMFAIILLNASIIGAAAVTLSTSYAFGDVFGVQHSLHRRVSEAKFFYASYTVMVVAGRRHRPHPPGPARRHHHQRPGPGRGPAAQRHRLPRPALQRRAPSSGPGSTGPGSTPWPPWSSPSCSSSPSSS